MDERVVAHNHFVRQKLKEKKYGRKGNCGANILRMEPGKRE